MPTVSEVINHRLKGTKGHVAAAIWCEEDAIELGKQEEGIQLSQKAAAEILDEIDRKQDCELGITWETLRSYIDRFKREHPHYRRYKAV